MMKRPRINKSTAKRKAVFEYLKTCAIEKHARSYKEIGNAVDLWYRVLRFPLNFIWSKCNEHGFPELNAIAVNGKSGRPGPGCPKLAGKWEDVRDNVFAFDWNAVSFEDLLK
jgi:hypothetical protein